MAAEIGPGKCGLKISGPLLSKLLHERFKHTGCCGGLLYGDIVSGTKSEITDAQHITTSETLACVQDYLPLPNKCFFSHDVRLPKKDAWTDSVHFPLTSCIGMYKIRNSDSRLSLLEKSMYKKLCKQLHGKHEEHGLVFIMLITYGVNMETTCWSWRIEAFIRHDFVFSTVKFEVSNLQGSVSGLYISQPSTVRSMHSASTEAILQSFQLSLTEKDGDIKVVEASRKVTRDLIRELDRKFESLEQSEKILDKTLSENSVLLGELKAMLAKKEAVKGHGYSKSSEKESVKRTSDDLLLQEYSQHQEESKDSAQNGIARRETQYQAVKRRSLEDIKRRSPVVVLEKLNMTSGPSTKVPIEHPKTSPKSDATLTKDLLSKMASSTKEDLRESATEYSDKIIDGEK